MEFGNESPDGDDDDVVGDAIIATAVGFEAARLIKLLWKNDGLGRFLNPRGCLGRPTFGPKFGPMLSTRDNNLSAGGLRLIDCCE